MTDLAVVGSGLYGLTVARLAAEDGFQCQVLEIRNHIGGNSWSEIELDTGIEFHRYGSHIFHTNSPQVWDFFSRFATLNEYRHRVFSLFEDRLFEMPPTLQEISWFFPGANTPALAQKAIQSDSGEAVKSKNLEEKAISLVGEKIYSALIKGYTQKQWQIDPKMLPAETINRLPFRLDFSSGYFTDRYQGIPTGGYRGLIQNLADHANIQVALETDYFENQRAVKSLPLVFTGPLDRFFNFSQGNLSWRTLDFEYEVVPTSNFQGNSVINYPSLDVPFTRIHEFKHLHPERTDILESNKSLIAREFSRRAESGDLPYYPINSDQDKEALRRYRSLAKKVESEGKFLGGRLGTYKYLDMHMAIGAAISDYKNKIGPYLRENNRG